MQITAANKAKANRVEFLIYLVQLGESCYFDDGLSMEEIIKVQQARIAMEWFGVNPADDIAENDGLELMRCCEDHKQELNEIIYRAHGMFDDECLN